MPRITEFPETEAPRRPFVGRCIRLSLGWADAEWLYDLPPAPRLAWIELVCHVKMMGSSGRVRAMYLPVACRKWRIPEEDISAMLSAAVASGALKVEPGKEEAWSIHGFEQYEPEKRNLRGAAKWKKLRKFVLERDDRTCQYCGGRASQVDHVTPYCMGGLDTASNLKACCSECNSGKGTRTLDEWERQGFPGRAPLRTLSTLVDCPSPTGNIDPNPLSHVGSRLKQVPG